MVKQAILGLVIVVVALASTQETQAQHFVRGHYRYNGSYVAPHFQSNPDGNFYNNYSTFPNVNPYTGAVGSHHQPSYLPYGRQHRSAWSWGW